MSAKYLLNFFRRFVQALLTKHWIFCLFIPSNTITLTHTQSELQIKQPRYKSINEPHYLHISRNAEKARDADCKVKIKKADVRWVGEKRWNNKKIMPPPGTIHNSQRQQLEFSILALY